MRNIITDNSKSETVLGSLVSSWKEEGIIIGKAEGKAEGIAEGRIEEKHQIALRLLRLGLELEDIEKATALSIKQIKAIAKL
jgi:predicted transposase/invertase (TIGR01784 family)